MFRYLQDPDVAQRFRNVRDLVRAQLVIIENELPGGTGLAAHWDEFLPDYLRQIGSFAQQWLLARIGDIRNIYGRTFPPPQNQASVLATLTQLERQIFNMYIPGSRD